MLIQLLTSTVLVYLTERMYSILTYFGNFKNELFLFYGSILNFLLNFGIYFIRNSFASSNVFIL